MPNPDCHVFHDHGPLLKLLHSSAWIENSLHCTQYALSAPRSQVFSQCENSDALFACRYRNFNYHYTQDTRSTRSFHLISAQPKIRFQHLAPVFVYESCSLCLRNSPATTPSLRVLATQSDWICPSPANLVYAPSEQMV